MSIRRDTEFRWQRTPRFRSKPAMSLLVGVAGLATGYMFVHAGRQQATGGSPTASTLETARTSISPSVEPAEDEPSAVATAATTPYLLLNSDSVSTSANRASDEPSAVGIAAAPPVRLTNPSTRASAEGEPGPPRRSATKSRPGSSYGTLRQALLRAMR